MCIRDRVKTGIINPIIIPEFADKVRSADWIVFTSKNGVRSFFYNLDLAGADIRLIASARFAAVSYTHLDVYKRQL